MKDAKGHGSDSRGSYQNVSTQPLVSNATRDRLAAAHQAGVTVATEGVQGRKLEFGTANAILHDTNSHDRDFHTLRSDQALRLADYAKQFGYRKSASSSGSTARAFHSYLSNRRDREIRSTNARIKKHYGT